MSRSVLSIIAALAAVVTSDACSQRIQSTPPKSYGTPVGVAVYTLSRGKGVPELANRVFSQAQELFRTLQAEKQVLRIHPIERIGIEGERRLCADFVDEQAARAAHVRLLKMAEGAELLNVVVEPCLKS
jgi:hypothetical protein